MTLPTRAEAQKLLDHYVKDPYQRHHALMVAQAMVGYSEIFGQDQDLWYITGLVHDIDFELHPDTHPAPALGWFKDWGWPEELIDAVEAHAYGYNGFKVLPQSKLAAALMACDEICGLLYAYQKVNPVAFKEMKVKSVKKRFDQKGFASKINREDIERGCRLLEVDLDQHINNLLIFLGGCQMLDSD